MANRYGPGALDGGDGNGSTNAEVGEPAGVSSATSDASDGSLGDGADATDGVVDGQITLVAGTGQFTSPSGNIACNLSSTGASCWIEEKEWDIEQPTHDPFCAESDWGNAVDVAVDRAYFPCYTDFGWSPSADPLPYGTAIQSGDVICRSAETGVMCRNGAGFGFQVSRSQAVLFPADGPAPPILPQGGQPARLAVATELVVVDTADPFLNVRDRPSVNGEVVAKLPPVYTGMIPTGERNQTGDSEWVEVELVDPVEVLTSFVSRYPTGWVNRGFTTTLPEGVSVTAADVAPCAGAPVIEDDGAADPSTGAAGYVFSVEHGPVAQACHRIVVSVGDGPEPQPRFVVDPVSRSAALPEVTIDRSVGGVADGSGGVSIDLGPISDAWTGASDNRNGVYLARGEDGYLDVITAFPVGEVTATVLAERRRLVIDLAAPGAVAPNGNGVVLLGSPVIGPGSVTVTGLARPFEANLEASILDANGERVTATFVGSGAFGRQRTDTYGLGTNDWTVAWGRFDLIIEDLDPGTYTLMLNGGISIAPDDMFFLPVTIP